MFRKNIAAGIATSLASIFIAGAIAMANAQPLKLVPEEFLPPVPAWTGASEKLIAAPSDKWITPAETTGLTETPNYEDTLAFLDKMDRQSALMRVEAFGQTAQARKLVAVILSKDGAKFEPSKPVFLVQAGIHGTGWSAHPR